MSISRSIIILLVTLVVSSAAIAAGKISGVVKNEAGRGLAAITVSLVDGDQQKTQLTDAFGRYHFPSVESGVYELTYEDRNFINFIDEDPFPDEGSVYISFTQPDAVAVQENQQLNLSEVVLLQTEATDNRQSSASVSNCTSFGDVQDPQTLSYALENAREIIIECTGTITVPEIIIRRDVVITAPSGASFEGLGSNRVLRVLPGVIAEIDGVNLTGGEFRSGNGSAVYNTGITTISNAEITRNSGNAATVFNQGILNLDRVRQFGNSLLYDSVYSNSGVISGTDITIESHTATGGPVISNTGTIELRKCSISGLGTNNVFAVNNKIGSTIKLFDCTVTNSDSLFLNEGTLEIFDSSLDGNQGDLSVIESSGVLKIGGTGVTNNSVSGLVIYNAGSADILNSTVSANSAGFSSAGSEFNDHRGVISNEGLMTIQSSTIAGNTHPGSTDRQIGNAGELRISNTIIAGTGNGEECGGDAPITSLGHNLHTDGTCASAVQSDIPFGNPGLHTVADNGGPGKTLALQSGSDAIDAGNCNDGTLTKDQRGVVRPQGNGCDIGAFELEVSGSADSGDLDNGTGDGTAGDGTAGNGTAGNGSTDDAGTSGNNDSSMDGSVDNDEDTDMDSGTDIGTNSMDNPVSGGGVVGANLLVLLVFPLLYTRRLFDWR